MDTDNLTAAEDKSNSTSRFSGLVYLGIGWKRRKLPGSDLPGLLDAFLKLGVPGKLVEAMGCNHFDGPAGLARGE
jgi:hypothetical protein